MPVTTLPGHSVHVGCGHVGCGHVGCGHVGSYTGPVDPAARRSLLVLPG